MSRSERLLALLQHLRRHRHPVSGATLAADLGISLRTLYRDIATLQSQGAHLDGAPGARRGRRLDEEVAAEEARHPGDGGVGTGTLD